MKVTPPHFRLLIWGASGHARVIADIIRLRGEHELLGFIDDTPGARREFLGLPVFHTAAAAQSLGVNELVIGVGHCQARLRIAHSAVTSGFRLVSAIHPRAIVAADASVGAGTVVAAGAVINPGCAIGRNVIVNTGATVDHDCALSDGVHIGPGVHLGGTVTVGTGTWVGIGATVKDNVCIGAGSVIGAGAVVLSDIPSSVAAWGVPAVVMRDMSR